MERYESAISSATAPHTRDLLAAIALVLNADGRTLYSHSSGFQSLNAGSSLASLSSNIVLGSAGKFITHIAALQLVEKGLLELDQPVYSHLPELEKLQIICPSAAPDSKETPFVLRPATKKITLRHLLSHTSGLSDSSVPLIQKYLDSGSAPKFPEGTHPVIKHFTIPLLFEPGEGWEYGCSIHWLGILVSRVSPSESMGQHVQKHIFTPLGMNSSSYAPMKRPEILANLLQMVRREPEGLVADEGEPQGLVCSIADIGALMTDLLSSSSKLLTPQSVDLLFNPQFEPSSAAFKAIRSDTENYASPAGIPPSMKEPPVNWSVAGALLVEEELPLSKMPKGTVTWNGMPNVVWAMNREKCLGMVWATQLLPVDDAKAVELMMEFMRCAWGTFGV